MYGLDLRLQRIESGADALREISPENLKSDLISASTEIMRLCRNHADGNLALSDSLNIEENLKSLIDRKFADIETAIETVRALASTLSTDIEVTFDIASKVFAPDSKATKGALIGRLFGAPGAIIGGIVGGLLEATETEKAQSVQADKLTEALGTLRARVYMLMADSWDLLREELKKHNVIILSHGEIEKLYERYNECWEAFRTHFMAQRLEESMEAASLARDLLPGEPEPYLWLASSLEALERREDALQVLASMPKIQPGEQHVEFEYLTLSGECKFCLKDYDDAESDFLAAISIAEHCNKSPSFAEYRLACIYAARNDTKKALAFLESAIHHGFNDVDELRTDEDLAPLWQSESPEQFVEKLVEAVWTVEWGFFNDDILLQNLSPMPLTNIRCEFILHTKHNGILKRNPDVIDTLDPGEYVRWSDIVSVTNSANGLERAIGILRCDQILRTKRIEYIPEDVWFELNGDE